MYKLKQKRTEAGLSQSQLAVRSGVSIRMVQAYEAEAVTAHKDINKAEALSVYKLSRALDCEVPDLLELDDHAGDM